jgi:hypothetical protein
MDERPTVSFVPDPDELHQRMCTRPELGRTLRGSWASAQIVE